jgi:hypothetical protein
MRLLQNRGVRRIAIYHEQSGFNRSRETLGMGV